MPDEVSMFQDFAGLLQALSFSGWTRIFAPCKRTVNYSFDLKDKALRKSIFNHIVRDIAHMNQKKRNQKARAPELLRQLNHSLLPPSIVRRHSLHSSETNDKDKLHRDLCEVNYELRDFFFAQMKETGTEARRVQDEAVE